MAQTLSALSAKATANASAIATAFAGGTTEAEIQALGALLLVLSRRNDLSCPALNLLPPTDGAQISPT